MDTGAELEGQDGESIGTTFKGSFYTYSWM